MPCCIAIIRFVRCGHRKLFKIGCTLNCDALCEPQQQSTMVVTKYRGYCEDCHIYHWGNTDDERALEWDRRLKKAEDDQTLQKHDRENITRELLMRENAENNMREKKCIKIVEEIQWAEDWTAAYGNQLWKQQYAGDPVAAARGIEYLKGVRKWDLVVVKDLLRTPAMLVADQQL